MAMYRTVWVDFWSDPKIDDDFTPEDKYFYLYLLTNPHTNICGCYEIGMRQMERETGYNADTIKRLLDRMKLVHNVLDYDLETKEIYILNWYKYNWNNSGDTLNGVLKFVEKIKKEEFRGKILNTIDSLKNDGKAFKIGKKGNEGRGSYDPHKTSVTVTNTITNTNSYSDSIKEIIDYLNSKTNSRYTYKNKSYNKHITARLSEGYTVDDFKTVIDKKCDEWLGDSKMENYLTPDTLFAPSKFEKYLNQKSVKKGGTSLLDAIARA